MNLLRRDLKIGEFVTIHSRDGRTARGRLVKQSSRYLTVAQHKLEVGGELVELTSDRLLIPREGAIVEASKA